MFKSNAELDLSAEEGNKIFNTSSRIDPIGKETAYTLSEVMIWARYTFLYIVFEPFAFGVDIVLSNNLRAVEKNILSCCISNLV